MKPSILALGVVLATTTAFAQSADLPTAPIVDDWIALQDEPSRQDLFKLTNSDDVFHANAIPNSFVFPQDAVEDSIKNIPRTNSIFGIDISHYTPDGLPFESLKAQDIRFVYAKATQGTAFKDAKFAGFWKALDQLPADQKVLRGAYHFLSSADAPATQAERFVAYVNLQGGFKDGDLPPVMDLEWDKASANGIDRWQNLSAKQIVTNALAFLARVQQLTGKTPMMYTARSWWVERGIPESDIAKFAQYSVWVADYSRASLSTEIPASPNKVKPAFWQFSESSKLRSGFTGSFDANLFKGSEEDFQALFFPKK